jgi:hypothetical protein
VGAYGAGRNTYKLVDRRKHDESINPLNNRESFFSWLGIIGTGFSFSATAATGVRFVCYTDFSDELQD